jgi:hypothetical protein
MERRQYLMEKETTALLNLSTTNSESNIEDKANRKEHSRQLLYEALRERGIKSNPITGEKIDEKSDIDTLLQVIQNEKRKSEEQSEILLIKSASDKSTEVLPPIYTLESKFWRLTYEFYKFWFSCLVLRPFATWLGYLMYGPNE